MSTLDEERSAEMPEGETPTAEEEMSVEEAAAEEAVAEPIEEVPTVEDEPAEGEVAESEAVTDVSEEALAAEDEPVEDEPVENETMTDVSEEALVAEEPVEVEAMVDASEEAPAIEDEPVEDETPLSTLGEEEDDGRAWYVVHCYSGYENKVRHNLEQRIETMGMKNLIFDVVVPTEEEIEVKEGKRRTVERRVFPGYILVNMLMTEESWYVVRNTPGVTSFVGMGNDPVPLRPEEVSQIIKRMEADAPRIKVSFRQGERVRIIDGPFNDFRGTVDDIDMERAKVRVMVNFFGRETPVELDFLQVEKA
jgi:transcriptional antiterminator NusG